MEGGRVGEGRGGRSGRNSVARRAYVSWVLGVPVYSPSEPPRTLFPLRATSSPVLFAVSHRSFKEPLPAEKLEASPGEQVRSPLPHSPGLHPLWIGTPV